MPTRYKCWKSRRQPGDDADLYVICHEGSEAFEALPAKVRHLGPWAGSREGEVSRLRLAYRVLLEEQGFVVVWAHALAFEPEAKAVRGLETEECATCKGTGKLPRHGGSERRSARGVGVGGGGGGERVHVIVTGLAYTFVLGALAKSRPVRYE